MRNIYLFIILFLVLRFTDSIAQQGIHTTGGNASGPGGSVSYSVGQVFYSSQSSSSSGGSLVQGVQHPYELTVTELKSLHPFQIFCEAFPNPTTRELNLRIRGEHPEDGSWKLIDGKGVALLSGKISALETLISMAAVPMAVYSLQVSIGKKEIKVFKIVKQ